MRKAHQEYWQHQEEAANAFLQTCEVKFLEPNAQLDLRCDQNLICDVDLTVDIQEAGSGI